MTPRARATPRVESRIDAFIERFTPEVAAQFRVARAQVRRLFRRGYELVYDNYNAFGCGYSTSPLNSGVLVSVVAYPRWVSLFFFHGRSLEDPDKLLQGSGARIRSIRLQPVSLVKTRAVQALLRQAIAQFKIELAAAPVLATSIKSIVAKQLPRRPAAKRGQEKALQDVEAYARVRTLCMSLPGTTETQSWGHPNFRTGKRSFVTLETHQGQPCIAIRLVADQVRDLCAEGRFFPTPYGKGQWASILAGKRLNWRLLEHLIRQSHALARGHAQW